MVVLETDLPIDLLRTFATVAQEGGFTAAARRLRLTQPAVSQQIQRLEQQAGTQLLDRTRRRPTLTPSGEVLLSYARHILRLNAEARMRLRAPELTGRVRFGVTEHVVDRLPDLLGRFARAHPEVSLTVEVALSSQLARKLHAGKLDLALTSDHAAGEHAELLFEEPLVWAGSAELAPIDGKVLPLVVFSSKCRLRRLAIERLDAAERKWRVGFTSSSLTGVRAAAAAGLGIAVMLAGAVGPRLRRFDEADGLPPLPPMGIVLQRRGGLGPAARSLAEFVRGDLAGAEPRHRAR